jgi:uncharacterized membrane protein
VTATAEPPIPFVAELRPHRSLGTRGFRIMMAMLTVIFGLYGGVFIMAGAWPVFGFLGVEILIFYVLFRLNYRAARQRETIRIGRRATEVRKRAASGAETTHAFQTHWLRIEEDVDDDRNSALTLRSHGRAVAVGGFLSPPERRGLARALRQAIATVIGTKTGA